MAHKESGYNQSETAFDECTCIVRRVPCSPAMSREGEVLQMQLFFIMETQSAIQSQVT